MFLVVKKHSLIFSFLQDFSLLPLQQPPLVGWMKKEKEEASKAGASLPGGKRSERFARHSTEFPLSLFPSYFHCHWQERGRRRRQQEEEERKEMVRGTFYFDSRHQVLQRRELYFAFPKAVVAKDESTRATSHVSKQSLFLFSEKEKGK